MHTTGQPLEPWIPLTLVLVIAPCWWLAVCSVVSKVGGWSTLAAHYRAPQPMAVDPTLKWLRLQSALTSHLGSYRNAVNFGVSSTGLTLTVMFLFKAGHPPLYIPWEELTTTQVIKYWYFDYIELKFRRTPHISFFIRPKLHAKLLALRDKQP